MNIKSASLRFAALLVLTTSVGVAAIPAAMAQTGGSDASNQAQDGHQHTPPPAPATVVRQLGLTGSKASQVQQLLEQRQAAWLEFRQQAKASHDQLKQLLTTEQWQQLRQIEHPHGHHDHHGHHAPSYGGQHDVAPAAATSAG